MRAGRDPRRKLQIDLIEPGIARRAPRIEHGRRLPIDQGFDARPHIHISICRVFTEPGQVDRDNIR